MDTAGIVEFAFTLMKENQNEKYRYQTHEFRITEKDNILIKTFPHFPGCFIVDKQDGKLTLYRPGKDDVLIKLEGNCKYKGTDWEDFTWVVLPKWSKDREDSEEVYNLYGVLPSQRNPSPTEREMIGDEFDNTVGQQKISRFRTFTYKKKSFNWSDLTQGFGPYLDFFEGGCKTPIFERDSSLFRFLEIAVDEMIWAGLVEKVLEILKKNPPAVDAYNQFQKIFQEGKLTKDQIKAFNDLPEGDPKYNVRYYDNFFEKTKPKHLAATTNLSRILGKNRAMLNAETYEKEDSDRAAARKLLKFETTKGPEFVEQEKKRTEIKRKIVALQLELNALAKKK